jgi:flagellar hook-associated protein 2
MVTSPSSLNRITGLASGMDIDGMVKKLMDAERIPLAKINANKQKLSWKQDAIRSLNLNLQTFTTGTQAMRLQSTFGVFTTTSTDSTVATASGTGAGSDSVAQFKNISSLATSASTFTNIPDGLDGVAGTKIDPTKVMSTTFPGSPTGTGSFTINALQKDGTYKPATITYDMSTDSLNTVLSKINSAGIGVTAFYDSGSDKVVMSTNATGQGTTTGGKALQLTDNPLPPTGPSFLKGTLGLWNADGTNAVFNLNGVSTNRQSNTFAINGINYTLLKTTGVAASTSTSFAGGIVATGKTVDPGTSLNSQAANFNTAPPAAGSNTFTIKALQADGTMKSGVITYDTNTDSVNSIIDSINQAGINVTASYDVNTGKVTIKNNINGKGTAGNALQISDPGNLLTGTFGLASLDGTDSTSVNVTATRDVDSIVTKIKDFIEKYNTMLDTLNKKSTEATYRDYQPLTEEQKTAMKEEDATAWETKAKSGNLSNDSILEQAIYGFRNDAYSTVNGLPVDALSQLTALGITTDLYQSGGKLIIQDETKLRAAISQTPDQVTALFTNHDTTDPTKDGIAWKLYNRANATVSNFTKVAGTSNSVYDNSQISKSITKLNTDIDDFNVKLQAKESAYYAKFTAMETFIAQLSAQSASVTSLLGSG